MLNLLLCLKKSKTIAERAFSDVKDFSHLQTKLEQSFSINGKAKSTLNNYLRCLAHLALHYNRSPEKLSVEHVQNYLYHCQKLHKTPSESFLLNTPFSDSEQPTK
ncbi:phage integrase N-terminal SAM-like domain-containing protein [Formosa sp. L2A11]|uniref:phage integrase N-terminal SAM-like domain-containing protein n=1 Tax=Formosa sp. L2A11 TaxID=2686363 RepID=UPI00351AF168